MEAQSQDDTWGDDSVERVYSYLMSISDYSYRIRHNDPTVTALELEHVHDEDYFDFRQDRAHILPIDWAELGKIVGCNHHLKELYLDYGNDEEDIDMGRKAEKEDLVAFCTGLKHNRSIETLHINKSNMFGQGLFANLAPFLESNELLRKIVVENDDIEDYEIPVDALLILSSSLPRCQNLTELRFIECDMVAVGIKLLSVVVQSCKALRLFELVGVNAVQNVSGIDKETMTVLVDALDGHQSLTELSLRRNCLGRHKCCSTLATLLKPSNSGLKVLNLQDNSFSTVQVRILAGSLKDNTTLQTLDRLKQKHTLIYIPSYFDYIAVRNLLQINLWEEDKVVDTCPKS